MRFAIAILLSMVATAAAIAAGGNDKPGLHSHGAQEVLAQRYSAPFDTDVARGTRDIRFHTQTRNQTPEAHARRSTDSSTPGTQIMSSWRQVIGGIAVAVLVAVV